MKYLTVSKHMSYFVHCACIDGPSNGIIEIIGSKQMCTSPDAFQTYATDETQSVGSSTGVMTPSFAILLNFALTLGHMEIEYFWGACMTTSAWSHSLMVYSSGNRSMLWNLSGNVLRRSSVDLIGAVFMDGGGAGVGQAAEKCLGWPWQNSSF